MKEYHLHKSQLPDGSEQLFITGAIRDLEEQTVSVQEIFVITCVGDKEVKSRIDIRNLIDKIVKTPGGNIPFSNFEAMYEMLNPVIPEQVQLQNQIDMFHHESEPSTEAEDFIFATDMASACHAIDFDTVLEELLNANPTCTK